MQARYRAGGLTHGDGAAFGRAAAFLALAIPTASRTDGPSVTRDGIFTGAGVLTNARSVGP